MTTDEMAKEITVALVNKLGGQTDQTLRDTSQRVGGAFRIIKEAIEGANKD